MTNFLNMSVIFTIIGDRLLLFLTPITTPPYTRQIVLKVETKTKNYQLKTKTKTKFFSLNYETP